MSTSRAVEDEERDVGLVAFDETASSAEHHVGNLVGIRTVGDIVEDLEAGRLELNDVQHVGVYHVLDLLPLDDMRGARVTLPFLVDESSHHDLSDVGRRLSQADVVVGASRNEFDRLVAISQHRDAQRRGFRRAVECETSVRPDRSAVGDGRLRRKPRRWLRRRALPWRSPSRCPLCGTFLRIAARMRRSLRRAAETLRGGLEKLCEVEATYRFFGTRRGCDPPLRFGVTKVRQPLRMRHRQM